MRIKTFVNFGQEVEVEIGMGDIRSALAECFVTVTADRLGEEVPSISDVTRALNTVATFLKALTDQQIAEFNDTQRKVIHDFLAEQAARYERVRAT